MVSRWRPNDCKSPQVCKILLRCKANFRNVVVWMVPTHSLISNNNNNNTTTGDTNEFISFYLQSLVTRGEKHIS